ncbi:MAG: hypothetical protein K6T16_00605 [Candidatus Pacearchaeota archaeon]|nr:hypothetical protein [Candidatus Pacearchaeota archaeon]
MIGGKEKKKERKNIEIARQFFHILVGCAILLLILTVQRDTVLISLFLLFLVSVLLSLIALKTRIPVVSRILEKADRESDLKVFPGKGFIFFIAGCLLTFKLFPQDIALASIVVLTFGDAISTLAGFFGKRYTKKPFSKFKTAFGTLLGIAVSFLIALLFIGPIYALTASVIGMFAEALSIRLGEEEADDNLIIPLAAGTACYLLRAASM